MRMPRTRKHLVGGRQAWGQRLGVLLCAALVGSELLFAPVSLAGDGGQTSATPRPRIGLVLAGGGAKGGAHIGVLKVLEDLHVPIDCIAGTSMGALVGGGYASGLPAGEIERFVRAVPWKSVIGGVGRRELEPAEQRRHSDASGTGLELGMEDGGIVGPAGLVNTSSIETVLRAYVAQARLESDFNRLPIPFRAVATDMVTGQMVVFDHGDLATVMRASMAIPGAFAPVHMDPYVLSDGFIVRNIPVDVARKACADVLIVVKLAVPATTTKELQGAGQLLSRTMDVMTEANENIQLSTLTDRDIRIDVPMGNIGAADFERIAETIPLGEAAARAATDRLKAYSLPEAQYLAWRKAVTNKQDLTVKIASVRFEDLKFVNGEYLRSLTQLRAGDMADTDKISGDAKRLGALNELDSVAYRLSGDRNNPDLVWVPHEREGARNVLRPSMGMYGSGSGELDFILGTQYIRRWINSYGAQWRNNIQLGYVSEIQSSFFQPLNVRQSFFVEPDIYLRRSLEALYDDGENIADYKFRDFGGRLEVGASIAHNGQVRLGYWAERHHSIVTTGVALMPDFDYLDAGFSAGFTYDSRDEATFATHGIAAAVNFRHANAAMGGDRDWETLEGGVRGLIPIGKNLMWLTVAGGFDPLNKLPGDRDFSLGGESFPGYQHDELRVGGYWTVSGSFLWRLADLVAIKNQALYSGLGLQAARLYDRLDSVPDGYVYGISGYLGGRTPVGTLVLGAGAATRSWNIWISLGRPIGKGSILDSSLFR